MSEDWEELQGASTTKWSGSSVDYTFLNLLPDYYLSGGGYATWYDNKVDTSQGFQSFSAVQEQVVYFLLEAPASTKITGDYEDNVDYRVSFSDVINFTFNEETQNSNDVGAITFLNASIDTGEDAVAFHPLSSGSDGETNEKGDILINQDSATNDVDNLKMGDAGYWIILHELGHAFGGLEDVENTTLSDTEFDNQKYTMMSYNPYGALTGVGVLSAGSEVYASGLQLFDIAALQDTYGTTNTTTRSGDTTYSLGNGLGFDDASADDAFLYTIWDGGGTDTIDASDFNVAAEIDLNEGRFSSIGKDGAGDGWAIDAVATTGVDPDPGNVAIANGTVIENAVGTAYNDRILGNDVANTLDGGVGNDELDGGDGDDILNGESGNDTLTGGADEDTLDGGAGADVLDGGADSDDYLYAVGDSYAYVTDSGGSSDDITIDANIGNVTFHKLNGDLVILFGSATSSEDLSDITGVIFVEDGASGSPIESIVFNDETVLRVNFDDSDASWDVNDLDNISYTTLVSALSDHLADAQTELGNGGSIDVDQFEVITAGDGTGETIQGTIAKDDIDAAGGNDTVYGKDGDDEIDGGAGVDTLHGGDGNDELNGDADVDTLNGDDGNDTLNGGAGDDTLNGGEHNDTLDGGTGADELNGDEGHDVLSGGDGDDELYGDDTEFGFTGHDTLDGGDGEDELYGQNGDDTLVGGDGDDHLEGGLGDDTYTYNVGDDDDVILEKTGVSGNNDVLKFGAGITLDDLNFAAIDSGDDLEITFDGTATDSIVVDRMNKGMDVQRTVQFNAYDLLKLTHRGTGGRSYELLFDALFRLRSTNIVTNIDSEKGDETRGFGWIDSFKIVTRTTTRGKKVMGAVEITLADWMWRSLQNYKTRVLTINRAYFKLTKGLERKLYELARRHCGRQPMWKISLEKLSDKCGTTRDLRHFKYDLKKIVEDNKLPDYVISMAFDGADRKRISKDFGEEAAWRWGSNERMMVTFAPRTIAS